MKTNKKEEFELMMATAIKLEDKFNNDKDNWSDEDELTYNLLCDKINKRVKNRLIKTIVVDAIALTASVALAVIVYNKR